MMEWLLISVCIVECCQERLERIACMIWGNRLVMNMLGFSLSVVLRAQRGSWGE